MKITTKRLQEKLKDYALLIGAPLTRDNPAGGANIGYLYISNAPHYGGACIERIDNIGGGTSRIAGRMPPRELYWYIETLIYKEKEKKQAIAEALEAEKNKIRAEVLAEILKSNAPTKTNIKKI